MEDNKYYAPSIEEFHVGFWFETKGQDDLWYPTLLTELSSSWMNVHASYNGEETKTTYSIPNDVRVPYLSKEDIESEGWKLLDEINIPSSSNKYYQVVFTKGEWKLDYTTNQYEGEYFRSVIIYKINTVAKFGEVVPNIETKFSGMIKNRSELKRILKMINL
jgi:hypothetical protein